MFRPTRIRMNMLWWVVHTVYILYNMHTHDLYRKVALIRMSRYHTSMFTWSIRFHTHNEHTHFHTSTHINMDTCTHLHVHLPYRILERKRPRSKTKSQHKKHTHTHTACASMRGWRNTVEIVLFEISNSMKPYPSVVYAYTNKMRAVTGCLEPKHLDKVSNRIPPTSQSTRESDQLKCEYCSYLE